MKKVSSSLMALFIVNLILNQANGQGIIRVTVGMDLQTEINNATSGSIFLVEHTSGNSIVVDKQVFIIGKGYKLGTLNTEVSQVRFIEGSDNSTITGMTISNSIYVGADNITVKRNLVHGSIYIGRLSSASYQNIKISNCQILQNYIESRIDFSLDPTNTIIKNNIIIDDIEVCSSCTGVAINNTILNEGNCNQEFDDSYEMPFFNNIIYSSCYYPSKPDGNYPTNSTFVHNIFRDTHYITSQPTNISLTSFSNEFSGYPSFSGALLDARFQLKSSSAAIGAGLDGVDCGAFGGPDPYVLNGIPEGPNILEVSTPSGAAAGQTITVNIQAVNQN
ncbi:hypothetical protein [uncultured Arcticibacterium sp.]|uniref:hypothetical protein n=1 Tax=uncultured Arcticibacterium sp. TaxID=2173042 RepID=UPI0030FBBED1